MKIYLLRLIHTLFALYFLACLVYIYYAAFTTTFDMFLLFAVTSLAIEGFVVYVLNKGDCPLIHIQRKIGDDVPYFELFFKPSVAKKALPFFAILSWIGLGILLLSVVASNL